MKESFSLKFVLIPLKENPEQGKIYIRIIVNRKKTEIATEHVLENSKWDASAQRGIKTPALNEELVYIENKIREIKRQLVYSGKPISARIIKDIYTGASKTTRYLIEYFTDYIKSMEAMPGEYSEDLVQHYKTTKYHLEDYLKSLGVSDIKLEEVDYKFLRGFDQNMLSKINPQYKRPMARNTANKQHSRFKKVLSTAVKEGLISGLPYVHFPLKNEKTSREFLTSDEIERIRCHALGDNFGLQKVRDIFLFSVYTGLRFSDALALKMADLYMDKDGTWWINNKAQEKTLERLNVPLLEPAKEIIDRYDNEEREVMGYVLPRFTNQKTNAYLKTIADLVGIKKKLTHHIARHTFATTITLSNEVPIEVVSKMLGHTNLRTTQVYAKITNDYLAKHAQSLNERLKVEKK
ncbi:site-specific integrase [Fulvivirga kasyanovii]|uniref:Site-specific integrase n=1 Tax=Fulvivirga kasyanovii TaxID=396812 RepID=A0ABW9RXX1_9BACT|nr:site-specific integrase [Fulvivirga kasyanovii]MTI29087.1 site-specific integrase [Fulvivirga kasyanovii]